MTDLSELIEKLEKATGQLDIDTLGPVICAGFGVKYLGVSICVGDDGSDEIDVLKSGNKSVWRDYRSRAPDVSIDAALAFVERVLPGFDWERVATPDGAFVRLNGGKWTYSAAKNLYVPERSFAALDEGCTPLAILIAALKALRGKNDADM